MDAGVSNGMSEGARLSNKAGTEPRADPLSWDDYFMSVAFLTAMRSKDPTTQVGAVIVNDLNRIIGVGYNGFPIGIPDSQLPWAKSAPEGDELATKYPYVVHAELNAVMNKNAESCRGCRIYSTLFPCNECAKVIIQAGIRKVIFASDKHHQRASSRASRHLLSLSGVEMCQHQPRRSALNIALRYPEDEPFPEPNNTPGRSPLAYCPQCAAPPANPQAPPEEEAPPTPCKSLLALFEASSGGEGCQGRSTGVSAAQIVVSAAAVCLIGLHAWRR